MASSILLKLICVLLMTLTATTTASPVSDPHLMANRYFPVNLHQPAPAYYYPPVQQRWSFLPSSAYNTRFLLPSCIPCGTRDLIESAEAPVISKGFILSTGGTPASGSPTTGGTIFDLNAWLSNPLGMFLPNGQQHPAFWPWLKPCCVIPPTTTTTTPPTTTTTTTSPTSTTTTTSPTSTSTTVPTPTTTISTVPPTTISTGATTITPVPTTTTNTAAPTTTTAVSTTPTAVPTTTSVPIGRSLFGEAASKQNSDAIPASGFKLLMNLYPPSSISIV